MQQTSNYALNKPEQTDVVNIEDLNSNFDTLDTEIKKVSDKANLIQTAGGTGTAITLSNVNLVSGFTVTFVVAINNNAAATTINGKPLYKPGGTSAPKLIAGKAVTVWYDTGSGGRFFIKASAEGDSVVGNVLAGKTFSNDDDTGLIGTMADRGAVTLTPGTIDQVIQAGYHNGSGKVTGDPDLVSVNIKAGANIFGVAGNANVVDTSDATAAAGDMLLGKTAYKGGSKITGTMPNNGPASAETINLTSEGAEYTIPAGYHSGLRKIKAVISGLIASVIKAGTNVGGIIGTFTSDANAVASDILSGKTAYVNGNKVNGSMPTGGNDEYSGWVRGKYDGQAPLSGRAHFYIPTGKYYSGQANAGQQGVFVDGPDFIPGNILSTANIFGMQGAAQAGKRWASGTVVASGVGEDYASILSSRFTLFSVVATGLTFKPSFIYLVASYGNYEHVTIYNEISPYYAKDVKVSVHNGGFYNSTTYNLKGDVSPAYVNSSGFKLPASYANATYKYIAFE